MLSLAQNLLDELRNRSSHFASMSQALLMMILVRLERSLTSGQPMMVGPSDVITPSLEVIGTLPLERDSIQDFDGLSPLLQRACNYIALRSGTALSPALVAHSIHVSPAHLNRLFRAELGMSTMKFVTSFRIEKARALLANTEMSVSEVAQYVGYRYASHFSQAFTQQVGVSPHNFRHGVKQGEGLQVVSG